MQRPLFLAFLLLPLLSTPSDAFIQTWIDNASDGDVIELPNGLHRGPGNRDLDFRGKAITLRSASGDPGTCVIDCEDLGRGFVFHSGEGPGSVIEGITIRDGYSSGSAGAIRCSDGSSPVFRNCVIESNTSYDSGGGVGIYQSSPIFEDCVFSQNHSRRYHGGAVDISAGQPEFHRCTFVENSAGGDLPYGDGGAVRCLFASALFHDCAFVGNSAEESGGAVFCHGSESWFLRCTFWNNTAPSGGAVFCINAESNPLLESCTLVGNAAERGAGVFCDYRSTATLLHTIIAFSGRGEGAACDVDAESISASCSDIFGNPGGDWVSCLADQAGENGNLAKDPLFCGPEVGDFTIREDSPCAPWRGPGEGCGLIGAWPVTCSPPTPIERVTWGQVKARFR